FRILLDLLLAVIDVIKNNLVYNLSENLSVARASGMCLRLGGATVTAAIAAAIAATHRQNGVGDVTQGMSLWLLLLVLKKRFRLSGSQLLALLIVFSVLVMLRVLESLSYAVDHAHGCYRCVKYVGI
ncbi:hypothetical protein WICPIJ_002956, partial [Wickerhamomyces pijperi]